MALVIPWLLVREYQQHRNALADQLSRVTGWRVVKVVIHPGELEEWARRQERSERSGALTVEWRFRRSCRLCLGAPLLDLLVLRHGAHPVDVRPHHWAHLRQGFLKDCLLLRGSYWMPALAKIGRSAPTAAETTFMIITLSHPQTCHRARGTAFRKLVFRT